MTWEMKMNKRRKVIVRGRSYDIASFMINGKRRKGEYFLTEIGLNFTRNGKDMPEFE